MIEIPSILDIYYIISNDISNRKTTKRRIKMKMGTKGLQNQMEIN
jgi:hypothetical protein